MPKKDRYTPKQYKLAAQSAILKNVSNARVESAKALVEAHSQATQFLNMLQDKAFAVKFDKAVMTGNKAKVVKFIKSAGFTADIKIVSLDTDLNAEICFLVYHPRRRRPTKYCIKISI